MRRHLQSIFAIAIFTFVSALSFPGQAHLQTQIWSLEDFEVMIEVHEDASMIVEETITAQFFENNPRRGIIRYIPTRDRDIYGNRSTLDFELLEVLQDGEPAVIQHTRSGGDETIRIGEENTWLTGEHIYTIRYRIDRAIGYYEDFDEVYWNATGNDWDVPVVRASAVIIFPEGSEVIDAACYTGAYGSTTQNCGIGQQDNMVAFAATEKMTIAASIQKGILREPTALENFWWFLRNNWRGFAALIFPIGAFILWFKYGSDRRMKTVVAEYEPPKDVLPAEAGLMTTRFGSHIIASMIMYLAVHGYMQIVVEEGAKKATPRNTKFVLKKKRDAALPDEYGDLLDWIFKGREEVRLKDMRAKSGDMTGARIMQALRRKVNEVLYTKTSLRLKLAILVVCGFVVFFLFGWVLSLSPFEMVMVVLSLIITVIFGFIMRRKSPEGAELLRQIKGFKLFMHTAERYRSQWKEREHIFEDYLPYAIAFKDTKHWAGLFAGFDGKNVDWYSGPTHLIVGASLMDTMRTVNTSAATFVHTSHASSGGSGSSGGGFSGGGGGGGGGSSW